MLCEGSKRLHVFPCVTASPYSADYMDAVVCHPGSLLSVHVSTTCQNVLLGCLASTRSWSVLCGLADPYLVLPAACKAAASAKTASRLFSPRQSHVHVLLRGAHAADDVVEELIG